MNAADKAINANQVMGLLSGFSPGQICLWIRPLSQIPSGWKLCDGTNDTPDLCQGRFVRGGQMDSEINTTGGTEGLTLTVSNLRSHTHGGVVSCGYAGEHNHQVTTSVGTVIDSNSASFDRLCSENENTNEYELPACGNHTHTFGGGDTGYFGAEEPEPVNLIPHHRTFAFIMKE